MSLYIFFYLFVWKKTGIVYDQFLSTVKLHMSREASEKVMTSCRSSFGYSPGTGTHFKSSRYLAMAEKTLCMFSVPSAASVATGPSVNVGGYEFGAQVQPH